MTFGQKLKTIREGKKLSQEAFGDMLGTTKQVISRYETDQRTPKITVAKKYASILDIPLGYLIDDNMSGNEPPAAPARIQSVITALPLYNLPVSAGAGAWIMDGDDYEYVEFENVPKDAEFALKVRGDSMEPMYFDGDIVFVKSQLHVSPWQAGVFYLNGDGYLKTLQGSSLVSCNSEYPPIPIGEFDSFFVLGRVVGKAVK